jgi:IS30 family transposase
MLIFIYKDFKEKSSIHRGLPRGFFINRTENALHESIDRELGTKSYFCEPYHSWEKGSIENRNGILRRYFSKKFNWALSNQEEIDKVVAKINETPMKCLGFKMPAEFFANYSSVARAY